MRFSQAVSMVVVFCAAHESVRAEQIQLRDGAASIIGKTRAVDVDGITVESDGSATRIISWDRVRDVSPPRDDSESLRLQDMADKLWRARTRVERGDHQLAEPLFEEYFETFLGRKSETALVVMEGLLRCRLSRGANELAVIPALEVARLRLAGVVTESYKSLVPVFDPATALCPYLPPFWVPSAMLPKVARQLATYDAKVDPVMIAIAGLYRSAVQRQAGIAEQTSASAAQSDHVGVRLLRSIVDGKSAGKAELLKLGTSIGPWAESWACFAIGQALLSGDDETPRREGMLFLLRVPAEFADSQPYLSGLALADVSQALAEFSRVEDAGVVRAELKRLYPHHPITAMLPGSADAQVIKGGS